MHYGARARIFVPERACRRSGTCAARLEAWTRWALRTTVPECASLGAQLLGGGQRPERTWNARWEG
eukprot:10767189-Alexandrium_andersonii.AAC.1